MPSRAGSGRFLGTAPVEVHTLLAHDHVDRYLVSLRSLVRFWPEPTVIVHDDGTLTANDEQRLAGLGEVTVISRRDADAAVTTQLADLPLLLQVRAGNVRLRQLVDYFALARSAHVLAMDSDVVFLKSPDRIRAWVASDHQAPVLMYSPEHGWPAKGIDWLPEAVPGHRFVPAMCCGFVAATVHDFFAPVALNQLMQATDPGILHQQRFVTQMFFSLMAGRLPPARVVSLGEPYRSGRLEWLPDEPGRVICHYFGSHDGVDGLEGLLRARPELAVLRSA